VNHPAWVVQLLLVAPVVGIARPRQYRSQWVMPLAWGPASIRRTEDPNTRLGRLKSGQASWRLVEDHL
jgi:hypothetical protein